MSRTLRIELSPRSVLVVIGLLGATWVLIQLWQVVLLLVCAAIIAGALNPVVDWLDGHGVRRGIALGLILAALIGAVVGTGALVIPALAAQVGSLAAGLPELQQRVAEFVARVPFLGQRAAAQLTEPAQDVLTAAPHALPLALRVVEGIALGLTTVMLAFYLLADRERVIGFLYALLPRGMHVRFARILLDMERVVGGYVRGQAMTSGLMAVFVFTLLQWIGAPNPLAMALLAAVADMVPFIGPLIVLATGSLAALAIGPGQALIALVALGAYHELEARFLVPRVYGSAMRLSPVAVIVAVMVGGKLMGLVGAVIALPIAAGIRVLVEDLRIELPGELPGEKTERAVEEHAERIYERRAATAAPVEAAQVAAEIASDVDARVQRAETGRAGGELPLEQRRDPSRAA
ncbi:MAG TPA: AI-2E family transporter [Chloroflexota bacterium]|nr:AI-2E family transporter [Chloroflexota bacterium]